MPLFSKLFGWLPNPFRGIRQHLQIETQWQQFKHHIKPHLYKIYIGAILVSYPLYAPYATKLTKYLQHQCASFANKFLAVDEPPFQITENFSKNLLGSILSDENIKDEGLKFVDRIIQDQRFVGDILQLLISALKNSQFLSNLQITSRELILEVLKDEDVQSEVKKTIIGIVICQQVKHSLIQLIEKSFSSPQAVDTIVNLLKKGITNDEVKNALSEAITFSVHQLLRDQETVNQLKIFAFFLLRKIESDEEIKGMMDLLANKGLGLNKNKKEKDFQKILNQKMKRNKLANAGEG